MFGNPGKLPEKKELETKTKLSEDPKERFLNELYQGQKRLYKNDVQENDEKSTRQFTAQTRLLVTRINIEQNKEFVFKKINAELKEKKLPDLTNEQKKLIYAKDFDSSDPIQSLFAKHMPRKWDDAINRLFDPYHSASLVAYDNSPIKLKEREKLFKYGKSFLETFCYFISQPNINPLLREIALTDAEYAIYMCPNGFLEHMATIIESFDSDVEKLVKHKYVSQAASNFRNKIFAERGDYHAGSNTKILTEGNSIHAESELKNVIHLNEKYSDFAHKSDDADAKNYFDEKTELARFVGFCFDDKKALQHNLIEILYSHFDPLLHGITDIDSADNFIEQLNSIGLLDEDRSTYTEEKEEKIVLKEEKEITQALRISLQKRLMTSNFLNEHISRKKIPLEKKFSYSLIMSSIPFTERDSKDFEDFIHSTQNTSHAYVLFDREADFVGYRCAAIPKENELEKFFLDGHMYAYGIFEKKLEGKETIEKELYYLEKNPAKMTRIKKAGVTIILKDIPAFYAIPTSIKSTLGDKIEKIKKLHAAVSEKIYHVTKEPFTTELVSKDQKIFQKIIEINNDFKNTDETIKSIQKLTKYVEPGLYINFLSPNLSYIKTDGKPLELFFDYFKTLSDQEQYHVILNTIDFNDNTYFDFLVECIHFIKDPTLLKNNLPESHLKLLFPIAINRKDFYTADRILQVNPILKENLLKQIKLFYIISQLVSTDDSKNIEAAFKFHKKYNLDFLTESWIDTAAKVGKIKSLESLLTIANDEKLALTDFRPNLMEGLKCLIKEDDYVNINYIITTHLQDQNFEALKELIRNKLLQYLDNNRSDQFKKALQYLPDSLMQDDKNASPLLIEAAKKGNFEIVNIMLEKKINDEIKYQCNYIEGLSYLIERNKTNEAFELISKHLTLSEEEQKILAPNFSDLKEQLLKKMIDYSKDLSEEGVKNLENALKIIQLLPSYQKEDLNTRDEYGNPIIFYAAFLGNLKALKLLKEYGANFEAASNNTGHDFYDNLKLCIQKLEKNKNYEKIDEIIKCYPEIYNPSNRFCDSLQLFFLDCTPILKSIAMHCPIKDKNIKILKFTNKSVYTFNEIKEIADYCQEKDTADMLFMVNKSNDENLINIIFLQILKQHFNQPENKEQKELEKCLQNIEKEIVENNSPNWENLLNQLSQHIPCMNKDILFACKEKFSVLRDKFTHFLIKNNHFESALCIASSLLIKQETIKALHDKLCDAIEQLDLSHISPIKFLLSVISDNHLEYLKKLTRNKLLQYLDNNRIDQFKNALRHLPYLLKDVIHAEKESPLLIEAARKGNFKIVNMLRENKVNDEIKYQGKTYQGHYIEGLSYLIAQNKMDEAFELMNGHLKLSKEEQKTLAPNFISLKKQLIEKMEDYSKDLSNEGIKNLEIALKITQHLPYYQKDDINIHGCPVFFNAASYGNLKALKLLEANLNVQHHQYAEVFYSFLKIGIESLEIDKKHDEIADIIKCYPEVYKQFLTDDKQRLKQIVMLCPIIDKNIKILTFIPVYGLEEIKQIANYCQEEKDITDMLTIANSFNDTNTINIIFFQILKQHFNQPENKEQKELEKCLQIIEKETLENKYPNWENLLNQLSQYIPLMKEDTLLACMKKFSIFQGKFFEFLIKNNHFESATAIIASCPSMKDNIKKETIKELHDQLSDAIQKLDLSRILQIKNLLLAISTNSTHAMHDLYVENLKHAHNLKQELYKCIDGRNTEKFKMLIKIFEMFCPNTLSEEMNKYDNFSSTNILSKAAHTGYFAAIHFLMDEHKVSIDSEKKYEFNIDLMHGIKDFIKNEENKSERDYKPVKEILEFQNDTLCGQPLIHFCLNYPSSLDRLIKSLKINAQDNKGCTALHVVAQKNNHSLIIKLIENDINIHMEDFKNNTAFHYGNEQTKALILILTLKKLITNYFGNNIPALVNRQLELINTSLSDEKLADYPSVVKELQEIATAKPVSNLFPSALGSSTLDKYLSIFNTGFFCWDLKTTIYSNIRKFETTKPSTITNTINHGKTK